eukprot:scaffold2850_cov235-Pinguiococcus_pyrenoidosus.AAC.2
MHCPRKPGRCLARPASPRRQQLLPLFPLRRQRATPEASQSSYLLDRWRTWAFASWRRSVVPGASSRRGCDFEKSSVGNARCWTGPGQRPPPQSGLAAASGRRSAHIPGTLPARGPSSWPGRRARELLRLSPAPARWLPPLLVHRPLCRRRRTDLRGTLARSSGRRAAPPEVYPRGCELAAAVRPLRRW